MTDGSSDAEDRVSDDAQRVYEKIQLMEPVEQGELYDWTADDIDLDEAVGELLNFGRAYKTDEGLRAV